MPTRDKKALIQAVLQDVQRVCSTDTKSCFSLSQSWHVARSDDGSGINKHVIHTASKHLVVQTWKITAGRKKLKKVSNFGLGGEKELIFLGFCAPCSERSAHFVAI